MTIINTRNSYDVAVVGSGPAGSTAALSLAEEGVRVAIIEKADLPRYKTCGGGITQRAIRLLPVDVSETIERECYTAELNFGTGHLRFLSKRSETIVSMTMRDRFDFVLVSAAREAGADLFSGCRVQDIKTTAHRVELLTNRGSLFSRFVIAADGATGVLAKKAGWQESRYLIPALEYEIFVSDELMERCCHSARFDFGLIPHGYAWIFPKRNHLSVGAGSMRRGPIKLAKAFDQYLIYMGLDKASHMKRHGSLIPMSPRKDGFVRRRVLLTGDAAGLADPIMGEGVTNAILSGQIAAKALIDNGFEEWRIRKAYESALTKTILKELRFARVLARLVYDYPKTCKNLFRLYGQRFTEAITDVFMGERTYGEFLSNPMNYLKLLSIHRR